MKNTTDQKGSIGEGEIFLKNVQKVRDITDEDSRGV